MHGMMMLSCGVDKQRRRIRTRIYMVVCNDATLGGEKKLDENSTVHLRPVERESQPRTHSLLQSSFQARCWPKGQATDVVTALAAPSQRMNQSIPTAPSPLGNAQRRHLSSYLAHNVKVPLKVHSP